jgi:alkaline phosphatase D
MRRRDFLKLSVFGALAAAELSNLGCESDEAAALRAFPQGVASGDPRPDRVVLWARVEPAGSGDEQVDFELSADEGFSQVVARGTVTAAADADHTMHVLAMGLAPATSYFYRFVSRGVSSTVGRTRTAPSADADVAVRLAMTSCQDYVGRYFHGWDLLASETPVDVVVFLGDYIYETTQTLPARVPTKERAVSFPDGLALADAESGVAAVTLADYRALYRTYKSDPDLRRMHAAAPFVLMWDDHEFSNDCWQDRTYYFEGAQGDEQRTPAREAATRAWFEYQPVDLPWRAGVPFPDDIVTYRSLRFGKHVELFLTDSRYYRDANLIQPGPADPSVGKTGTNTMLGARTFVLKAGFDALEAQKAPSMLGATQRDWFIGAVTASSASWKLWCNQTMAAQLLVDLRDHPEVSTLVRDLFYFKLDQWDGYRSERAALLQALSGVEGFVVLSGDLHGFYAAELRPDPDGNAAATTVEYVVSSISAPHLQAQLEVAVQVSPLLSAVGLEPIVARSDEIILASNPGIRYANSAAHGYALVDVDRDQAVRVEMVTYPDAIDPARPTNVTRVTFRTAMGSRTIERVS